MKQIDIARMKRREKEVEIKKCKAKLATLEDEFKNLNRRIKTFEDEEEFSGSRR